jgi:hypothetical protein
VPTEKLHHLSEVLSENISDECRGMLAGWLDKVILVNSATTVSASGSGGFVHIADFCPAVYGEIVVAARALKQNGVHH